MTILEYYTERSKDSKWYQNFQSTSDRYYGKLFRFTNTNFRTLYSYESIFVKFLEVNNKSREEWEKHSNHGQEVNKQHVVRMRESKFFKREKNIYTLTFKGESFERFLKSDFLEEEKWIIIYFYLLNAYFNLTPLYIKKTVNNYFNSLSAQGLDIEFHLQDAQKYLSSKTNSKFELFEQDLFWIVTFNHDKDFIDLFVNSTTSQKNDLKKHIFSQLEIKNSNDLVVKKYKQNGQFTVNMFIDELKIIYMSHFLLNQKFNDLNDFIDNMLLTYSKISMNINSIRLKKFILNESDVFNAILNELWQKNEEDLSNKYELYQTDKSRNLEISEKLDDTSYKAIKDIARVSNLLKRLAKEKALYLCELEILNDCRYFTSKENNYNYLEIHHLIPREFSNEFENSIEVIDNYVALCPHCHRLIHFGTDRERLSSLNFLYSQRSKDLLNNGLIISIDTIKDYYDVNI